MRTRPLAPTRAMPMSSRWRPAPSHGSGEVVHDDAPLGRGAGDVAHADAPLGNSGELALAHLGRGTNVPRAGLKRRRARQGTPPAVRREVFWRDRGRCCVPGCRNATYLDVHHLDLRSEGGGNDPDNLVVLCGAHHGAFIAVGCVSTGRFRTGCGSATLTARLTASCRRHGWPKPVPGRSPGSGASVSPRRPRGPASNRRSRALRRMPRQRRCCARPSLAPAAASSTELYPRSTRASSWLGAHQTESPTTTAPPLSKTPESPMRAGAPPAPTSAAPTSAAPTSARCAARADLRAMRRPRRPPRDAPPAPTSARCARRADLRAMTQRGT